MALVRTCALHVCALFVLTFVMSVVFAVNAVFALIIPWADYRNALLVCGANHMKTAAIRTVVSAAAGNADTSAVLAL